MGNKAAVIPLNYSLSQPYLKGISLSLFAGQNDASQDTSTTGKLYFTHSTSFRAVIKFSTEMTVIYKQQTSLNLANRICLVSRLDWISTVFLRCTPYLTLCGKR